MHGKLVSVIIASYNMAQYLPLAIKSVLNQTYGKFEIHVIDDGSTDSTKEIMDQFLSEPKIQYHYQKNMGQAAAKNKGVRESRGEYIAFLDADDLWLPRKLELQIPLFDNAESIGVVYSGGGIINGKGDVLFPATGTRRRYRGNLTGRLLIANCIPFCSAVVRKKCFNDVGLFDETLQMGIDYDLWLRISAKYEFDCVKEPTYYYREWEGQMSRNIEGRYQWGIKIMKKFIEAHPGLVDDEIVREAWAHTYTGKGAALIYHCCDYVGGLKELIRAIRYKADYWPAWKEFFMIFPRALMGRFLKK